MKGSQDMTVNEEKSEVLEGGVVDGLPHAEVVRFYSEVGREVVELGRMFRSPTDDRPFVYELRVDLWPARNVTGLAVVKGFGADGGLIAFQEGSGLVGQLRGLYARARSGKMHFTTDKFPPANYDKRVAGWLKEMEYAASKTPPR